MLFANRLRNYTLELVVDCVDVCSPRVNQRRTKSRVFNRVRFFSNAGQLVCALRGGSPKPACKNRFRQQLTRLAHSVHPIG